MSVTREEIIWAYRMILGREPEGEKVISEKLIHKDLNDLRNDMLASQEFLSKQKRLTLPKKWICSEVYNEEFRLWLDLSDRYVSFGCLLDNYEPLESTFIRLNLKEGESAMDIGANIGWHTLGMAKAVGSKGKVFAFEPRKPTNEYLERTISENNLDGVIKSYDFGLWDEKTIKKLAWSDETDNPGGSYVDAAGSAQDAKMKIELRILDQIEFPKIDFIKIDIEGAEYRAFQGAKNLLLRDKPLILSELHPGQLKNVSSCSTKDYINFMHEIGYVCNLLEGDNLGKELTDYPTYINKELTNVVFVPKGRSVIFPN